MEFLVLFLLSLLEDKGCYCVARALNVVKSAFNSNYAGVK